MSLAATTLSAAIGVTDNVFGVASATNISNPNYQIGDPTRGIAASVTYLLVEQELMKVTNITGTTVQVIRGELGTQARAHGASAPVVSGLPSDFQGFNPAVASAVPLLPLDTTGFSAPLAISSNTIAPTGPYHHVTGTTVIKTITLPPNMVEGGEITLVFDGSGAGLTWDATGNISVLGTATTAASAVTFVFDQGSAKWHPSRLA